MNANYFITRLQLEPHPEGGYFREIYRSSEKIDPGALPSRFEGTRNFSTAIYYLLRQGEHSLFHRIRSDECWHFYAGDQLLLHVIEPGGSYYRIKLGPNIFLGETFTFVVPAGAWFAAEPSPLTDFSLCGCTVSPGFDFADFELASQAQLLDTYPGCSDVIHRLCRV